MSIESLSPGPEITTSNLLEEVEPYYHEGGIIPKQLRKDYYVALYDTKNNLIGRFIGQYMGVMEVELTPSKYQALLLKSNQIINFKKYADKEDNMLTTLMFTNIRKAGKIGTGIQAFKPIDYEEGEFNNDIEERAYSEISILEGEIGVEFPLKFSQKYMNYYKIFHQLLQNQQNSHLIYLATYIVQKGLGLFESSIFYLFYTINSLQG